MGFEEEMAERYISGGDVKSSKPSSSVVVHSRRKSGRWKYIIILLVVVVVIIAVNPFDVNFMIQHKNNIYATEANGFSMQPTIECGSIVVIQNKDDPDFSLAIGDILVFLYPLVSGIDDLSDIQSDDDFIIVGHTIIGFDDDMIICKGDNNAESDPPVYDWQILGKVVVVAPRYNLIKRLVIQYLLGGTDNVIS